MENFINSLLEKEVYLHFNLKIIRTTWGKSQKDMGKLLLVSRESYNNYESGASVPKLKTCIALQLLTGVNVYDLFYRKIEVNEISDLPNIDIDLDNYKWGNIEEPEAIYNKDVEDKLALFAKELAKLQNQVEELEVEMDRK